MENYCEELCIVLLAGLMLAEKTTGKNLFYIFCGVPTFGPDQTDITNQFIRVAVDGGMLPLILFIAVIVLCFRGVGQSLNAAKDEPFAVKITIWALVQPLLRISLHLCQ